MLADTARVLRTWTTSRSRSIPHSGEWTAMALHERDRDHPARRRTSISSASLDRVQESQVVEDKRESRALIMEMESRAHRFFGKNANLPRKTTRPSMRRLYHDQLPLCPSERAHPRAVELAEMSRLLDATPSTLAAVRQDLAGRRSVKKGLEGLSAEQVLRAALVKQMFDVSYHELAFLLEDSVQLRAFCRLSPSASSPRKSTLQFNIGAIRPKTWEAVNQALVLEARTRKVEDGRWMRTDATVVESNIHHPLDSSLLWDGVRVLTRLLLRARDAFGTSWCNHARRAKRRSIAILHAGTMQRRVPLYKDLLKVAKRTVACAQRVVEELSSIGGFQALAYACTFDHYLPLVSKVIDQTERRVLDNEQVSVEAEERAARR